MKGDFHVRFLERLGLKCLCLLDSSLLRLAAQPGDRPHLMRNIINIHLPGFIKLEQMILDFLHIGQSNFISDRSSCLATKSYAGKTDHGEKSIVPLGILYPVHILKKYKGFHIFSFLLNQYVKLPNRCFVNKVQRLEDRSEKPGEDFVRWLCAGLVTNSRNKC